MKRPANHSARPLFAPGTVQGYRIGWLGTPAQRRELLRFVVQLVAIGTAAVAAALLLGLLAGAITGRV